MLLRHAICPVAALLLLHACTPGGPGSTDDSAGSGTGSTSGSTSGSTADPVTTGSTGGDPTTSTGTTGDTTTTSTTDTSTGDATTDASTTSSTTDASTADASTTDASTTDASTGDASTGDTSTGDASTGDASTGGGDGLGPAALAAIDALTAVVDGVKWPSESDYGWTVFGLPKAAPVTIDNLKQVVGDLIVIDDGEPPLAEQGVEEEPWEQRFDKMTTPQPWWEDYNYMLAEQYEAIRAVLKAHLINIKLFRVGPGDGNNLSGAIDMFVIGETADGDLVGIQTVSVET